MITSDEKFRIKSERDANNRNKNKLNFSYPQRDIGVGSTEKKNNCLSFNYRHHKCEP